MKIITKRLVLREMYKNDFDDLYKVLADSDIINHYPYIFSHYLFFIFIIKAKKTR